MAFNSILFLRNEDGKQMPIESDFLVDLNLNQIIDAIDIACILKIIV